MSQRITAFLKQETEKRVSSTLEDLCMEMGTTDECSIAKQKKTHLTHLEFGLRYCQ